MGLGRWGRARPWGLGEGKRDGRLAFPDEVFRPAARACGVRGDDLADNKPIEQHPYPGELGLDRRRRHPALDLFDAGGDAGRGPRIVLAGVRVPDMGGEDLDDAALGVGIAPKQRREPSPTAPLDRQGL